MTGTPVRQKRRERRRSIAAQVLQRLPVARLFAGARRPLFGALERLWRSQEIGRRWRQLLRRLSPGREEYDALAQIDLGGSYRLLEAEDYEAFGETLQRQGRALALRGVREEDAVLAIAFYLESCLGMLLKASLDRKALALALVRLTAATQRSLLAGYATGRTAGRGVDDQERKRLSRDLHDEIGADLVVLKLYIEMIAIELEKGNVGQIRSKLEEAKALISRAVESVRRLTLDLGPAVLEQLGFMPAIRMYARQFGARTGITVQVQEGDMPASIPPTHETALYRVLQGTLSNVLKHARAANVRVTLGAVRGAVLVMIVEDDGVGFDIARLKPETGFGLRALRDRIQGLGGRLHIESRRARGRGARSGTRIEIDLPLRPAEQP